MPTAFRILLVDDDTSLQQTLTSAAQTSFPEALFTQVTTPDQARDYLTALRGYGPQLLLLDINLNNLETGLDFLSSLRANKRYNHLPVVMLTISQAPLDIQLSYEKGANSFSNKPLGVENWQTYLGSLRNYWVNTVTLPIGWYEPER